jgi:hypothetical protein
MVGLVPIAQTTGTIGAQHTLESILPVFLLYAHTHAHMHARAHAHTDALWFTITGSHTFITTTGTGTLMSQHQLHHVDESTPTAPHCL